MNNSSSNLRLPQFISTINEQSGNYSSGKKVMRPLLRVSSDGRIYLKDKNGAKKFLEERDKKSFLESTLTKFDYHYDID